MDLTVQPGKLSGSVEVIPSKSQAHRLLICAAFAEGETNLVCRETNRDIEATVQCLSALGAEIHHTQWGYHIRSAKQIPDTALLNCHESGSTLRFMLPVAAALGVDATFLMEGRLPARPLSPLWEEMERMGCALSRPTADTVRCTGRLRPGSYRIDGSVSSQFITGLLLALPLLEGQSSLEITGKIESRPYIDLTRQAISLFGADPDRPGAAAYVSPGTVQVEGDWSNGAFWLAAQALGSTLTTENLAPASAQGDRAAAALLPRLRQENITVSAADIPDLIPILAVTAAASHGAVFTEIQRLRLKESDRVTSTVAMIRALGGKADAAEDTLTVWGTGLTGGCVNSFNDHRIAMSAAIAATVCNQPVTISGANCVEKSYPRFWEEYKHLGGRYEQHLR
jgi:3-phosphoshikimate 1-carboxyvinyltransferase